MNCLKNVYCRIYQTAFKTVIPVLPYRQPYVLNKINEIPILLNKKGIKSVLIVTDKMVRNLGLTKDLEDILENSCIDCNVYDKTVPNPTTDNVEEARSFYVRKNCQAIIGFGGGSSMDCAKAVGARVVKPKQSLSQMKGLLKIHKKLPLFIAIPTTAGTGSETTLAAVITDSKTRHKYPVNDFVLIPDYAVLDSEITKTMPKSVTAQTGMDALTHAVEAYIGRSTTKDTRENARKAVRLIFENIFEAYENGDNIVARRNMLEAAYLAGCAFTKSYVGYVHAVAHSLGGQYNVPHGLANAVLLPVVLEAYGESTYKKLHELAIVIGISDKNESHRDGAMKFISAVKNMQKRLGIPYTIKAIKRKDVPKLAKIAEKEGNPLYPVPKLMSAKELELFYYEVMER